MGDVRDYALRPLQSLFLPCLIFRHDAVSLVDVVWQNMRACERFQESTNVPPPYLAMESVVNGLVHGWSTWGSANVRVGHQDVGMDSALILLGRIDQTFVVKMTLLSACEYRLPIVTPMNNVLGLTWQHVTREARHADSLCQR